MEKNVVCGSYIPAGNLAAESAAAIDFARITHAFLAFSLLHEQDGRYVPFYARCENPVYEWKGYCELMGMVD